MPYILVSGSTASDIRIKTSSNLQSKFQEEVSKESLHINCIVPNYEINHGGSGSNIAYNLSMLTDRAILLSSVGKDYKYLPEIQDKINLKYVYKSQEDNTAQSFIFIDDFGNKVDFFTAGAMNKGDNTSVEEVQENLELGIVSANYIPAMLKHASELKKNNIPSVLDPGNQIYQMKKSEILEFFGYGDLLIMSAIELEFVLEKIQMQRDIFVSQFSAVIVTQGEKGSIIYSKQANHRIPSVPREDFIDSIGAGDAYKAGMLYALHKGYDLEIACKVGTIAASYSILTPGAQHHYFTLGNIMEDMKQYFHEDIDLYKN